MHDDGHAHHMYTRNEITAHNGTPKKRLIAPTVPRHLQQNHRTAQVDCHNNTQNIAKNYIEHYSGGSSSSGSRHP